MINAMLFGIFFGFTAGATVFWSYFVISKICNFFYLRKIRSKIAVLVEDAVFEDESVV